MKKKLERLCTVAVARLVRRYSYLERLGIASAILVDFNEGLSPVIRASGDAALGELPDAHKDILAAFGAYEFLPHCIEGSSFSCGGPDYISSWIGNIIHGIYVSLTNVPALAQSGEEKTSTKESNS